MRRSTRSISCKIKFKMHLYILVLLVKLDTQKQSSKISIYDSEHEAKFFSVSKKQKILRKAETSRNISATARVHNVPPSQIRYWRNGMEKSVEKRTQFASPILCFLGIVYTLLNCTMKFLSAFLSNGNEDLLYLP